MACCQLIQTVGINPVESWVPGKCYVFNVNVLHLVSLCWHALGGVRVGVRVEVVRSKDGIVLCCIGMLHWEGVTKTQHLQAKASSQTNIYLFYHTIINRQNVLQTKNSQYTSLFSFNSSFKMTIICQKYLFKMVVSDILSKIPAYSFKIACFTLRKWYLCG